MAALLTACQGGQATPPPLPSQTQTQSADRELQSLTLFDAQNVATGEHVRTFPTKDAMDAFRLAQAGQRTTQATGALLYHGGPIQTNPKMYVVFWGSSWNSSTGDPQGVKSRMLAFLGIVGGSGWNNSTTQYTQTGGAHVGNQTGSLAASYVDTTSSPPSRPTQAQMAAEAAKAAAKYGDYSASAAYIVALPHNIKPSGFGTQYCAYHSTTSAAGHTIAWTNDPYLPDVGSSCGAGSVNSPGTLDGVSIVFGHEQGETETDPQPNTGWLDSGGSENGDLCAWTNDPYLPDVGASCGAGSVNSPGTLDGVSIVFGHEQGETETDPQPNTGWLDSGGSENGDLCAWTNLINNPAAGGYPTQPLYSNATASCVQSY